ncbi:MAG TPA: copper oxidase [Cyanobacteria bacterium UBA11149]|nr:copper oxidase [Cyanobacteria bacterium UBA11367]HBE59511.1 copper oxidase [Cyanobacteria bacterium UBA11366]HBK66525.1 copper oxidase [Cyanobacteria bacterium UBA11166]HBR77078.1 copper oxidase [Cyanobacteria bacterium UBA11159]HBS68210.1 copper oxidase [Cyanobacteria bacterium UBA11153]HBW90354.1 copper oxidase [Cyanobacteria bacterium UBA11149]HCA93252.1 copper oxidase [Cyanobacteria bacterium UBA9226]
MPNHFLPEKAQLWHRRQLLKLGLVGVGLTGATLGVQRLASKSRSQTIVKIPPLPQDAPAVNPSFHPMKMLRDFDYGTVKEEKGRKIREFRIIAGTSTVQLNSAVSLVTWNYNGRIPGPTLRATGGDRIRVIFLNNGGHAHTIHFHGIHTAEMDGVKPVGNGKATIYEFDAEPFGVHLYHCHIAPVTRHISKGLYGMLIIDPPQKRPPADEMVIVMGGYDLNEDNQNELFAFNGIPNYYMEHPIPIYQNQLIRLYLLNLIEFNPVATFHIHANFFRIYPTGMTIKPTGESDVITMGTAERHILEFAYPYTGKYMFHPHQDAIAEAGCMGHFDVISPA